MSSENRFLHQAFSRANRLPKNASCSIRVRLVRKSRQGCLCRFGGRHGCLIGQACARGGDTRLPGTRRRDGCRHPRGPKARRPRRAVQRKREQPGGRIGVRVRGSESRNVLPARFHASAASAGGSVRTPLRVKGTMSAAPAVPVLDATGMMEREPPMSAPGRQAQPHAARKNYFRPRIRRLNAFQRGGRGARKAERHAVPGKCELLQGVGSEKGRRV